MDITSIIEFLLFGPAGDGEYQRAIFGFLPLAATAFSIGKSLFGRKGEKPRSGGPQASNAAAMADINRFVDFQTEKTIGLSERFAEDFRRSLGQALGDLGGIGALRSGASVREIGRAGEAVTDRISANASFNVDSAIGNALNLRGQQLDEERLRGERRSSTFGAIGGLIGKGLGVASNFFSPGSTAGKIIGGLTGRTGGAKG